MQFVIDAARVAQQASMRHDEFLTRHEPPDVADPIDVAATAADLARLFYYGDHARVDGTDVKIAEAAGRLVYGMYRYGMDFEELCDVAEPSVAKVVAGLSPDARLGAGRRHIERKGRLQQADVLSHLVVLAELSEVAKRLEVTPDAEIARHAVAVRAWVEDALDTLTALTRLQSSRATMLQVAAARRHVDQLRDKIGDGRRLSHRRSTIPAMVADFAPARA